ncbi:uncharacterized protein LOC133180163 [Saccostrea echinata]|uniref:uncharacterized protein LOC133180163 n=1 Tax=Saccostrea echinata TaxID=191078 RepID=UPI002A8369D4|nr:uncharacterized protein LOC133180163 [Saccostrea echinata]
MTLKRNLKRFLILWSSIFYCFSSLQNGFSHLQHGYRLDRKIINVFDNYSILDCVKECLRTARCQSVNYHKGANICEINYENKATGRDHYTPSYGWIYTNAIDWIRELTGVCLNSNCGTNETCIPLPSGDHRCALSDCGVPVISGADMDSLGRWDAIGIERTMELECLGNYVKIGTGILRCTVSGQWTIDLSCDTVYGQCSVFGRNRIVEGEQMDS